MTNWPTSLLFNNKSRQKTIEIEENICVIFPYDMIGVAYSFAAPESGSEYNN